MSTKPYRSNKVPQKLRAEKARLLRLYKSRTSPKVKEQIKHAGRAITAAIRLLEARQEDAPSPSRCD